MAILRVVATILTVFLVAPAFAQTSLPLQAPIVCGTPEPDLRAARQRDALARSLFNPEAAKAYEFRLHSTSLRLERRIVLRFRRSRH
jgi:hypothetical protein